MKKGFCVLLLAFVQYIAFSQTKITPAVHVSPTGGNKTLLWRISGHGLQKTSYLFGTMHLKDKRLFNFDDSVYLSIEKCEGMAMEVNPDEMVAYFLNQALEEKDDKRKLRDILSEKDFKKYAAKLSAKLKKPADQISTADIIAEKNKWTNDIFEKGDMQTFVDAYLYGLARKQGKWVGGIEDIEDQTGLLDNFDNSDLEYLVAPDVQSVTDNTVEQMISLYLSQDIDGINEFVNKRYSKESSDKLLIRRNVKMTRRMDSLSALRSMFFAVGAAHLCGDSGVISLLKKQGFTVEPVFSAKKIPAAQYKVKAVEIPWKEIPGEKGLYTLSMPGNPATVKVSGLVNMQFLMDITNFTGQMSTAVPIPGNIQNRDSLMNQMAKLMYQTKQKTNPKKVVVNGCQGMEYIKTNDKVQIRMQLFFEQNVMYMVAMFAYKKEMLLTPAANKYFTSFKLNRTPQAAVAGMQYHTDSIMGVRFVTPSPLTYSKQMSDVNNETWKISAYTATDPTAGIFIMLFSKEVKPRYHILTDTALYHEQQARLGAVHSYFNQGIKITPKGKIVEYWGKNKENPKLYTRGLSTTRNNRNITLLVLGDSVTLTNAGTDQIFSSLDFIDKPVQWKAYEDRFHDVRMWLPENLRHDDSETQSNVRFAYDTTTATSYIIRVDTFGKYVQYAADTTFWNNTITEITEGNELLFTSDVKAGNVKGKELMMKHSGSYDNYTRMRIYVSGNRIYRVMAASGKELLSSENVNRLFSTFSILKESGNEYITSSKIKIILRDLEDTAQETRYAAYNALESALFGKNDLGMLHDRIFKKYLSPYSDKVSTDINVKLYEAAIKLNSPTTISLITERFPSLTGDKAGMQIVALSALAKIKNAVSFEKLGVLLDNYNNRERIGHELSDNLGDSLALTKTLLPQMLGKLQDTSLAPSLAWVILKLIDSSQINIQQVMPAAARFCEMASALYPSFTDNENEYYDFEVRATVRLLSLLNTPEAIRTLNTYTTIKNKYWRRYVLLRLIHIGQPAPQQLIDELAADREMRNYLFSALEEDGHEKLFPKKYLTQPFFAEGDMYNYATEDASIESMEFLKTIEARHEGTKYLFYLYRIHYPDDGAYLGIAGGYNPDKKQVKPLKDFSAIKEFKEGVSLNDQLKEYLEN